MTLQELISTPICGNFHQDRHIFEKVDEFVMDTSQSVADKASAIRWLESKVMGVTTNINLSDNDLVIEYFENM